MAVGVRTEGGVVQEYHPSDQRPDVLFLKQSKIPKKDWKALIDLADVLSSERSILSGGERILVSESVSWQVLADAYAACGNDTEELTLLVDDALELMKDKYTLGQFTTRRYNAALQTAMRRARIR